MKRRDLKGRKEAYNYEGKQCMKYLTKTDNTKDIARNKNFLFTFG